MITIDLGDNKTLQVSGVVEHFEAEKCKQLLSQYIAKTSEHSIQIDISNLKSVSSITLSFLLFGLREAKRFSKKVCYHNISPALFNVARVSGIEGILTFKQP